MTDARWQTVAAAAPVGLAALIGGVTWVTLTAGPDAAASGRQGVTAGPAAAPRAADPTAERASARLRRQIHEESRHVRLLRARLEHVRHTTREVRAGTPSLASVAVPTTGGSGSAAGVGGGWQAPSVPSTSNPAPNNPPPTQTTTGASGTSAP